MDPATRAVEEVTALTSYSLLHDRRIPQSATLRLEKHFRTDFPGGSSYPAAVLRSFENLPLHYVWNEQNHVYGFRPKKSKRYPHIHKARPAPKIDLVTGVRLNKRLLDKMIVARNRDPKAARSELPRLEDMLKEVRDPKSKSWAWLRDNKGEVIWNGPKRVSGQFSIKFTEFLRCLNDARCKIREAGKKQFPIQWSADFAGLQKHRECLGVARYPDRAETWLAPLGVGHAEDEIFLIFKFPAADAGLLCRPSHLDAGFYHEHFPSPLDDDLSWMAHPMYLASTAPCLDHLEMINEYVHSPVCFKPEHLYAIAEVKSGSNLDKIPNQRKMHWSRLQRKYPLCTDLDVRLFPAHTGTTRCDFKGCGCSPDTCIRILK